MNHQEIPTLPYGKLDRQEFFNRAATAIIAQGQPAQGMLSCVYRSSEGLACAIGQFIPDDKYRPEMDIGNCGPDTILMEVQPNLLLDDEDVELLRDIQSAHDNAASTGSAQGVSFVDEFKDRMIGVASDYQLSDEVVR